MEGRRKKRVYVAGPMSGYENWNYQAFDAASADLRQRGYEVINPVDLDRDVGFDPATSSPEDFDLPAAIRRDIEAILSCQAIVMLPGHENSKGATAERHVAQWVGIDVLVYPSLAKYGDESLPVDHVSGSAIHFRESLGDKIVDFAKILKDHRTTVQPIPTHNGSADGQTVTNDRGGKQSFISARFDCIPPEVLRLLAQCLGFGARKYGRDNWRQIDLEDNIAHAMNHLNEWNRGDRSEPHLVNAMARITFALSQAVAAGWQEKDYIHPEMVAK